MIVLSILLSALVFGLLVYLGVELVDKHYPATTKTRALVGSAAVIIASLLIHSAFFFGLWEVIQ